MKRKAIYRAPQAQIITFDAQDIITTSGGFPGDWVPTNDDNSTVSLPKAGI